MWHSRPRLCKVEASRQKHSGGPLCHTVGYDGYGETPQMPELPLLPEPAYSPSNMRVAVLRF